MWGLDMLAFSGFSREFFCSNLLRAGIRRFGSTAGFVSLTRGEGRWIREECIEESGARGVLRRIGPGAKGEEEHGREVS
jgi:hypothetical protein